MRRWIQGFFSLTRRDPAATFKPNSSAFSLQRICGEAAFFLS